MSEAMKLYYGNLLPELWRQREWGLLVILGFVFHLGPLVAREESEPWEQPFIYATF